MKIDKYPFCIKKNVSMRSKLLCNCSKHDFYFSFIFSYPIIRHRSLIFTGRNNNCILLDEKKDSSTWRLNKNIFAQSLLVGIFLAAKYRGRVFRFTISLADSAITAS